MEILDLLLLKKAKSYKLVEDTATGNPVAFNTNVAKPLNSVVVPLSYTQSGTGDPSPSNVRPISGVSSLSAYRTGVNIFDEEFEEGYLNQATGQNKPNSENIRSKNYISVVPGEKYYFKYNALASGTNMRLFYYGADKSYKSNQWVNGARSYTMPSDAHYVRFYMDSSYSARGDRKISINYPYTETDYVPYNGTELNVTFPAFGKNLFNAKFSRTNVDYQTGAIGGNTTRITSDFVELAPNTYTFSLKESKQLTVYFYTQPIPDSKYFVLSERISAWQSIPFTFTTTEKRYVLFVLRNSDNSEILTTDVSEVMLNTGSSASAYEPYNNSVYGGSLDLVSGVLTLTHQILSTTWGAGTNSKVLTTNERRRFEFPVSCVDAGSGVTGICNIAKWTWDYDIDVVHFYNHKMYSYVFLPTETSDSTELQIVGKLATPITVQLTPNQINAIKGNNTVWTNTTGNISLTYLKKS